MLRLIHNGMFIRLEATCPGGASANVTSLGAILDETQYPFLAHSPLFHTTNAIIIPTEASIALLVNESLVVTARAR